MELTGLKSYQAMQILENVATFTGMAIQGKSTCKYVHGISVSATSTPQDGELNEFGEPVPDFNNCTVNVFSGFYSTSSLQNIIEGNYL